MKTVVGKILKNFGKNKILIQTKDKKLYELPRISARKINGNGEVEFEIWKAKEKLNGI